MAGIGRWPLMGAALVGACGGEDAGLFRDPPAALDPPAELRSLVVPSHGAGLLTRVLVAPGPGPHPLLLLLHGFPGNENNFDVAHALRRTGWNVAVVHYRGSWGSPGRFTFSHVVEDVHAAVDHLRSDGVARSLRTDPDRVFLAGHSMGGFAALHVAARRADVSGAAGLAAFNFGASAAAVRSDPAERRAVIEAFRESLAPLDSPGAEALVREYVTAGAAWDLRNDAGDLRRLPVLLVAGRRDEVAPAGLHHVPLERTLRDGGHPDLTVRVLDDDHGFSSSRIALTRILSDWLPTPEAPR